MLESKFILFPAKSLLSRAGGLVDGRAAGEFENKANLGQIQLNLPVVPELGMAIQLWKHVHVQW